MSESMSLPRVASSTPANRLPLLITPTVAGCSSCSFAVAVAFACSIDSFDFVRRPLPRESGPPVDPRRRDPLHRRPRLRRRGDDGPPPPPRGPTRPDRRERGPRRMGAGSTRSTCGRSSGDRLAVRDNRRTAVHSRTTRESCVVAEGRGMVDGDAPNRRCLPRDDRATGRRSGTSCGGRSPGRTEGTPRPVQPHGVVDRPGDRRVRRVPIGLRPTTFQDPRPAVLVVIDEACGVPRRSGRCDSLITSADSGYSRLGTRTTRRRSSSGSAAQLPAGT